MMTNAARRVVVGQAWDAPANVEMFGAAADRFGLSRREVEVLRLSAGGLTATAAAAILGVTEATIKFHLAGVRKKLRVRNTAEAITKLLTAS
ncbi:LuxR C-terminal-related transcriptional regulator [Caulobacter mirabilis]|uniref:HTH luxR-type domain-containing protein n=1 Tax=Caulobacter mirabilis TaxID=69666 RepID=A0A2D2B2V4_9CAUL|nr:LuxR C-terminal-related transcriptional regulator [Caulobacter mirabilis]ATQ44602.1 hypothetical protein CSW64_20505 [Caulobacter mirabilis]